MYFLHGENFKALLSAELGIWWTSITFSEHNYTEYRGDAQRVKTYKYHLQYANLVKIANQTGTAFSKHYS